MSDDRIQRCRSFTLIETLAVIVVLSLIAGTAIVQLSAVNDGMLIESIASQIRDLDAKARLLSRTGEACQLSFNADSHSLILHGSSSAEAIASVHWPQHLRVEMQTDTDVATVIEFDRFGRSIDYTILLATDASVRTWRVAGLAGYFTAQETAP